MGAFGALALALAEVEDATAQSKAAARAKVSLIAENDSLEAAETAWVGVLFDLEKGWHIYWQNPGDSGGPPTIDWQLPPGYRAGDIRWPIPVRLVRGAQVDYGYEGRVLLVMPLHVPTESVSEVPVPAADVRYLICREVCIPAKARVTLSIGTKDETPAETAARRELFRAAREQWPKSLPPGSKTEALDEGRDFVLSLETGTQEAAAMFFPLEADQIDNGAPQAATPLTRGVRIKLRKSDQLMQPISTLKGLVVLGSGSAFEIAAPVAPKR